MKRVFDDVVFDRIDGTNICSNEYNGCVFKNCDFSNLTFECTEFVDCRFESCNLSMVKLNNTILNQVSFESCKLLGVDFSKCSKFLFSVSFKDSVLNYSLFSKNDLKNTVFDSCSLSEVSFIDVNLTSSKFINCDLDKSVFDRANLEKVDFATARNYAINPEYNKLKKARFSIPYVVGLLSHLDIVIDD